MVGLFFMFWYGYQYVFTGNSLNAGQTGVLLLVTGIEVVLEIITYSIIAGHWIRKKEKQ